MAQIIHERVAAAPLLFIPGAMHCSVMESADEFNRALLEFVNSAGQESV